MVKKRSALEYYWNKVTDQTYKILFISLLILFPLIIGTEGFNKIPIITDIYSIIHSSELIGSNTYILKIMSLSLIFAIFAASWDLLSGYTGQFSFGHALFWGFSAYMTYWFMSSFSSGSGPLFDPLTSIILGAIMSSLIALALGLISLRLKGSYFALITLIVPIITYQFVLVVDQILLQLQDILPTELSNTISSMFQGGNFGIPNIPLILEQVESSEINAVNFYFLILFVFLICVGLIALIAFSRIGYILQSIREDEEATESVGINITYYKILAFIVSAFFAGIAGGMYGQYLKFTGPSFFDATISFTVIIMVVIGGIGSVYGGVIGAVLLTLLINLLLNSIFDIQGMEILVYGLLLVMVILYLPNGLVRSNNEQKRAMTIGIMLPINWIIIQFIDFNAMFASISIESLIFLIAFITIIIITIPAIPIFMISEIIGIFILQTFLGVDLSSARTMVRAKYLINLIAGISIAYYLPKIFKKTRLRFWGVWPSIGQYEPE